MRTGHVRLGLADALVDRARRVTDLQAHVPQAVEDRLGDDSPQAVCL